MDRTQYSSLNDDKNCIVWRTFSGIVISSDAFLKPNTAILSPKSSESQEPCRARGMHQNAISSFRASLGGLEGGERSSRVAGENCCIAAAQTRVATWNLPFVCRRAFSLEVARGLCLWKASRWDSFVFFCLFLYRLIFNWGSLAFLGEGTEYAMRSGL